MEKERNESECEGDDCDSSKGRRVISGQKGEESGGKGRKVRGQVCSCELCGLFR